jgi:hypothetical protein
MGYQLSADLLGFLLLFLFLFSFTPPASSKTVRERTPKDGEPLCLRLYDAIQEVVRNNDPFKGWRTIVFEAVRRMKM